MSLKSTFFSIQFLKLCFAFNFDSAFIDIIKSDVHSQEYFGYSVLLQKGQSSSVLVGATKTNSSNFGNVNESGAIYKCNLEGSIVCVEEFIGPISDTADFKSNHNTQLLGAALDGGENDGDSVIVCAPRWKRETIDRDNYYANGFCYVMNNHDHLYPFSDKYSQLISINKSYMYNYAHGQAGLSIHYLQENKGDIILGAPGVYSWRGSAVYYISAESPMSQKRRKRSGEYYRVNNILSPLKISYITDNNTYFGYSVGAGKFQQGDKFWSVAGVPRGNGLKGEVFVFELVDFSRDDIHIRHHLVGEQMGSYFGGSVLTAKIASSSVADLLVGAPTFREKDWDEGRVYYYKNNGKGGFDSGVTILKGSIKAGSRFGTALSNLGDINGDSFGDVAISAPYENGNAGTVYIYLGSNDGISSDYSQKLSAKTISNNLKGFGFSLSRGTDIDLNDFNDLAIGAYKSDRVVIVKSRPVVTFIGRFFNYPTLLPNNTRQFLFTYCLGYSAAKGASLKRFKTDITVTMSNIKETNLTLSKQVEIKNGEFCETALVKTNAFSVVYFTKPIHINVSYDITSVPMTGFCKDCPLTDPSDRKYVDLEIPFSLGCGDDNVCEPVFDFGYHFEKELDHITLGQLDTLKLYVDISNAGETAFLTMLNVTFDKGVQLERYGQCDTYSNVLKCPVADILLNNEKKVLTFEFGLKNINASSKELLFHLVLYRQIAGSIPITRAIRIPLKLESTVDIFGVSDPDQGWYVDDEKSIRQVPFKIVHKFKVSNRGPSPVPEVVFNYYVPVGAKSATNVTEIDVRYASEQNQISCEISQGFRIVSGNAFGSFESVTEYPENRTFFFNCSTPGVVCANISLRCGQMAKSAAFSVTANLELDVKQLGGFLAKKDLLVFASSLSAKYNDKLSSGYLNTLLLGTLPNEEVAWWIIFISVITAIILLAGISFILYKLNFFKRKNSEGMQRLEEIKDEDIEESSICE